MCTMYNFLKSNLKIFLRVMLNNIHMIMGLILAKYFYHILYLHHFHFMSAFWIVKMTYFFVANVFVGRALVAHII